MAGELQRAVDLLNERKAAIVDGQGKDVVEIGDDQIVVMLSGFDLDPEELKRAAAAAGRQGAKLTIANVNGAINPVFSTLWADGLAMGLLIAQAREREGAGK